MKPETGEDPGKLCTHRRSDNGKLKEGTQVSSSLMMEEIDGMIVQMRLKDSKTVLISKTELTDVQFQKLRKHFETDRYPNEETLQALAEELKLQKEVIRSWFITQRQRMMGHRRFLMRYYRDWITCCEYSTTRRIDRQAEELQGVLSE